MNQLLRRLLVASLAIAIASCSASPTPKTVQFDVAGAELADALPFDAAVRTGRLDNGLTYFVRTNSQPAERAELRLVVNAGSVLEDDDQRGLAHFVEHMAFNGTERFARQELVDYLESIGMQFGPDLNAFTSFDETVYMLKVPTDEPELLSTGLDILHEWAGAISFEDSEIDKERGVVLEEWRLGRGADARMRDAQFPVLLQGSRYADRLPIGDPEIIRNAPYEALRRFYTDWYRPDLMAVIAIGDFDGAEVEKMIRDRFANLSGPSSARSRPEFEVPGHAETLVSVATDPEATITSVSAYTKLKKEPDGEVGDYRRSLVEALYNAMLNDRLREIGQRPDAPFVFASASTGSFVRSVEVYSQTAVARPGAIADSLGALLIEAERVAQYGFTRGELERAKSDLQRSFERSYEERTKRQSRSYAAEYRRHFLEAEPSPGIEIELQLVHHFLPGITLDELNHLGARWNSGENRVILLGAPEKDRADLPDPQQLLAVVSASKSAALTAWVDEVRDEPLLAEMPQPGLVVDETQIEEIGVTEWRLANGVRVILKPTDFKNDQILLGSFSPGGLSLVADDEVPSARLATSILREGGLGEFSRSELSKALAGKIARASAFIAETTEGIDASASPADLETMLQLLYLSFTEPRADQEAFASMMARIGALIENRRFEPEAVFGDRLVEVLSQGSSRRRPFSPELLEEVDLETAAAIYRDRFRDAGDFTFLLVGNFEPEAIRPLIETYLGGLPTEGRREAWRDVGIRPPTDEVEFEISRGLEPKSRVQFVFTGPAEWSRQQQYLQGTLARALRIRLREILREDMGGTYGVQVRGSIVPRPWQSYRTSVGFGCDPGQVDELRAALETELDRVRRDGFDEEVIAKVKASQTRERETQVRSNEFWLDVLDLYYDYGMDPRLIVQYDELVDNLDNEALIEAARRYLDPARRVVGILYPETTD